eukprot:Sspe_Gene.23752::Locus_9292_Transcript_1_1_Confidence_1.000_Length_7768::g.23752::m.23752
MSPPREQEGGGGGVGGKRGGHVLSLREDELAPCIGEGLEATVDDDPRCWLARHEQKVVVDRRAEPRGVLSRVDDCGLLPPTPHDACRLHDRLDLFLHVVLPHVVDDAHVELLLLVVHPDEQGVVHHAATSQHEGVVVHPLGQVLLPLLTQKEPLAVSHEVEEVLVQQHCVFHALEAVPTRALEIEHAVDTPVVEDILHQQPVVGDARGRRLRVAADLCASVLQGGCDTEHPEDLHQHSGHALPDGPCDVREVLPRHVLFEVGELLGLDRLEHEAPIVGLVVRGVSTPPCGHEGGAPAERGDEVGLVSPAVVLPQGGELPRAQHGAGEAEVGGLGLHIRPRHILKLADLHVPLLLLIH